MANNTALEQNSHARWLRLLAKEIRAEGHPGWVHTVEFAADEIDKIVRQVTRLQAALRESREYILDNGDERTMAPMIERIDDALKVARNG